MASRQMLEINLIPSTTPTWFAVSQTNPHLVWPRAAYYFMALFILSSIVRYQPELMYQVTSTIPNGIGCYACLWPLVNDFIPILCFNWIHKAFIFL
jgi:hypothetical protein